MKQRRIPLSIVGKRRALGATPNKIVSALLFESVLVTTVAGYLGLVLGVGLLEGKNMLLTSSGAQMAYFKRPEVDFSIALRYRIDIHHYSRQRWHACGPGAIMACSENLTRGGDARRMMDIEPLTGNFLHLEAAQAAYRFNNI